MQPSPEGFCNNPSLVYNFYNKRRKELNYGIKPNRGHYGLVELEKTYKINIITQNIYNLHEKAGSLSVIFTYASWLVK